MIGVELKEQIKYRGGNTMNDVNIKGPEAASSDKLQIIGKVEIFMLSNGTVSVNGPIKDPGLMLSVFGSAMLAVANYSIEKENSNIIVPDVGVS